MPAISSSQQKLIIVLVICLGSICVLWFFMLTPLKSQKAKLIEQKTEKEIHLDEIEQLVDKNQSAVEVLRMLSEKNVNVGKKFPAKEEVSLGLLSDLAKKNNVEISSLQSNPKIPYKNHKNKEIIIEDQKCQVVRVSMSISSQFGNFVNYIESLEQQLPGHFTIEDIRIGKNAKNGGALSIALEVNLYLLS